MVAAQQSTIDLVSLFFSGGQIIMHMMVIDDLQDFGSYSAENYVSESSAARQLACFASSFMIAQLPRKEQIPGLLPLLFLIVAAKGSVEVATLRSST